MGSKKVDIFAKQYDGDVPARRILRYGAFGTSMLIVFYNYAVHAGLMSLPLTATAPTDLTLSVVTSTWVIVGVSTMLIRTPKHWLTGIVELSTYLLLAAAQTLLISGVASPVSILWVLLLVAGFVLFKKKGMAITTAWFVVVAAVAVATEPSNQQLLSEAIVASLATIIVSWSTVGAYVLQLTRRGDLTESKKREELERGKISTLINNITDAVFSTNHDGIVKVYNSAALNLLDTNAQIEGRHISEIMHVEDQDGKAVDVFEQLSKQNSIRRRDDLTMLLADSDRLRLEATFAPVQKSSQPDGTPESYVLILRDITRMKSLEEERDEFISVVSHELRTPVTIAEGSLDNAEIMAEKGHTAKIPEAIAEAHKQVLFLAKMINDLSTLSRAERGISDTAETIDVTELAHQLHSEYTTQAKEKGLAFDLDLAGKPGTVHVSRLYLQELLQNLITNAIKYTQEGSVALKVRKSKEGVEFSVSDTGIGIGKSDQQKIFSRFYRAEDYRTRETNGTGLGLYVAAKLAKKMKCTIDVKSRLNHGSTFSFVLPVHVEKK